MTFMLLRVKTVEVMCLPIRDMRQPLQQTTLACDYLRLRQCEIS